MIIRRSFQTVNCHKILLRLKVKKERYYMDTDEIPGFLLLLKNHIFTARSKDTIFLFHMVTKMISQQQVSIVN